MQPPPGTQRQIHVGEEALVGVVPASVSLAARDCGVKDLAVSWRVHHDRRVSQNQRDLAARTPVGGADSDGGQTGERVPPFGEGPPLLAHFVSASRTVASSERGEAGALSSL